MTRRYTLILVGAFAAIGLLLAAVGVYGVISYATSQRAREFGIRIALGATRGHVISHVLRGSVVLTTLGTMIGVLGALFLTRSLASLLFEVSPLDVLSFSTAVALLAFSSIGASLLPAWRASRVGSDHCDAKRVKPGSTSNKEKIGNRIADTRKLEVVAWAPDFPV
jgi:putative ABC transport system permease protein